MSISQLISSNFINLLKQEYQIEIIENIEAGLESFREIVEVLNNDIE